MHGVTPETAWYMLHRLREAMKRDPLAGVLRGTIVADETWVGGDPKNVHASKLAAQRPEKIGAGEGRPNQRTDKTPVLALRVNGETGEVVTEVVTSVNAGNIGKFLGRNVDIANSVLHTDESRVYWPIGGQFQSHEAVNHSQKEYVRDGVTTRPTRRVLRQLEETLGQSMGRTTTSAPSISTATSTSSLSGTRPASWTMECGCSGWSTRRQVVG